MFTPLHAPETTPMPTPTPRPPLMNLTFDVVVVALLPPQTLTVAAAVAAPFDLPKGDDSTATATAPTIATAFSQIARAALAAAVAANVACG